MEKRNAAIRKGKISGDRAEERRERCRKVQGKKKDRSVGRENAWWEEKRGTK